MQRMSLSTANPRKTTRNHTPGAGTGSRHGYTKDDQDLSQSLAIGWCLGLEDWWPDITRAKFGLLLCEPCCWRVRSQTKTGLEAADGAATPTPPLENGWNALKPEMKERNELCAQ